MLSSSPKGTEDINTSKAQIVATPNTDNKDTPPLATTIRVAGVSPVPGEVLRYRVKSRSRPWRLHLVDLSEFKGNGQCTCEHFEIRCMPKLIAGASPDPILECYHIRQAKRQLVYDIAATVNTKTKRSRSNQYAPPKPSP